MKTMLHPKGNIIVVSLKNTPSFGPDGLHIPHFKGLLEHAGIGFDYVPFHCTSLPDGAKDGVDASLVTPGFMNELDQTGDLLFPPHDGRSVCTTSINVALKGGKTPVVILEATLAGILFGRHPSRVRLVPVESHCEDAEYIFSRVRVSWNYAHPFL